MAWSNEAINRHIEAAVILDQIKNETFELIRKGNVTEIDVHYFVLQRYVKYGIRTREHSGAIVAFGKNTTNGHNVPTYKKLKDNTLIMLDLWGGVDKRNAPFADITWMGYYGNKIPEKIEKIFNLVIGARNKAIKHIQNNMIPTGCEIEELIDNFVEKKGYNIINSIGHSLGYYSPHGEEYGICYSNNEKLMANMGYTIEPEIICTEDQFGVRVEMDFYISKDLEMIITTELQKKLVLL